MKTLFFTLILLIVTPFISKGQDTLRLLNGNTIIGTIGEIGERTISYSPIDRKKRSFLEREKRLLFSFTKEGGKEVLIYKYNPEIGNIYKVDEMRNFIIGEQHADKHYKSRVYNVLSLGIGAFAGYLVADEQPLYVATPLVFSSIIMIPGARVRKNEVNRNLLDNEPYRAGYKRVAKGKKFLGSLKYGALGMIGSILYVSLQDN